MLLSTLVSLRTKEFPADAQLISHKLMLRAGYIKGVGNGIFTMATPAILSARKIENIIREEMNAIDGQEVSFPVVMPKELWEESGRYSSIGEELMRMTDRQGRGLVLGMTHEEAAVHLFRDWVSSYQQLPAMIYQIQTKFRDEARARGGLIRVREFVMKDAYSFHTSVSDLKKYYKKVYDAYNRIFTRIGLKNFVAVGSDTGMMGGSVAHEFMLLTPSGEDTIVICKNCGYKANMEVAVSKEETYERETVAPIEKVFTGKLGEIKEICEFLKVDANKTCKAVCYNIKGTNEILVCFIRGDLEINEAKVKHVLKREIGPVSVSDNSILVAGNIGPIGLNKKNVVLLFDNSLKGRNGLVAGANEAEYHIVNLDFDRDMPHAKFNDIAKVKEGARCPVCGKPLSLSGGIEIGNIFQLGTKYSKAMDCFVTDKTGKQINPIMGCYGIGIGRALASVIEESNDEKGMILPMAIAPWQVYLIALRIDDPQVKTAAKSLYKKLSKAGIEVLFDDTEATAGVKFSNCDLMGIPVRIVISPKTLQNEEIEVQLRDGSLKQNYKIKDAVNELRKIIKSKK